MVVPPHPPRTKGNKRERTRARLIDAAVAVIRERGFYHTTLEEVARRAGMTRGAIYGNFTNKDELFLAVADARWKPVIPIRYGTTLEQHMRIVGEAVVEAIPARRAQALGALSFYIYALTHEDVRSRIAQLNRDIYRRSGETLERLLPPDELPMPPEQFGRVLHALADGLLLLRLVQPELVTDELIRAAFAALA